MRALVLSALLAISAGPLAAQLISIKTVPIAQADQFNIVPSRNAGLGTVSIALPDTLFDATINPAKGARFSGGRFFGSPMAYVVSFGSGAGRTLPVGAFSRIGNWFGGIAVALQEVDAGRTGTDFVVFDVFNGAPSGPPPIPSTPRTRGNNLGYASFGRSLGRGVSVGVSAFGARLSAIDGVDFLYSGNSGITQSGWAGDVRLGILKEWAGATSLEAVALFNRYHMTHDVAFIDRFWDPATQAVRQTNRSEHNIDHSDTWGLHAGVQVPVGKTGWRLGAIGTANRMSHPNLPNYDFRGSGIVGTPSAPGNSWAFNAGLGASKVQGATTIALDVIYEPIWTNTRGEVENHFVFNNWRGRIGLAYEAPLGKTGAALVPQIGMSAREIHYDLDQIDNVLGTRRQQSEHWRELTNTWGLAFRFPEMEIRYTGRVTTGVGRPGVNPGCGRNGTECFAVPLGVPGGVPSRPVTLGDVAVGSHQISISLPLGRASRQGGAR